MNRRQEIAAWFFGIAIALGLVVTDNGIWAVVLLAALTIVSLRDRHKKKSADIVQTTITPAQDDLSPDATHTNERAEAAAAPQFLSFVAGPKVPMPIPPYTSFIGWVVSSLVTLSAGSFFAAQTITTRRLSGIAVVTLLAVVLFFCLGKAKRNWTAVVIAEPEDDVPIRTAHRKIKRAVLVFAILFCCISAIAGNVFGGYQNRLSKLHADQDRFEFIAGRIGTARSQHHQYIADYISMYKSIEQDVNALSELVIDVQENLQWYDSTYPVNHKSTQLALDSYYREGRRLELLRKQIATAKELDSITPNEWPVIWRTKMVPLAEQEDQLDAPPIVK